MSIKEAAKEIIDNLPDNAEWDDLVKSLIKQKKITLGLTDIEVAQDNLTDAEVTGIITRLHSAQSIPGDHRNTETYNPGNSVTLGMVAGIAAVLFAFIFPPISWIGAGVAFIAGLVGLKNNEPKAWIPILLAIVSTVPILLILG